MGAGGVHTPIRALTRLILDSSMPFVPAWHSLESILVQQLKTAHA